MRHIRCEEGCAGETANAASCLRGSRHDAASHADTRLACTIESKY